MKTTFILKDLSEVFYRGGFGVVGLLNLDPLQQFLYLNAVAMRKELKVTLKIGNDSFRDRVDFNAMSRNGLSLKSHALESRRGYKLATFEFLP